MVAYFLVGGQLGPRRRCGSCLYGPSELRRLLQVCYLFHVHVNGKLSACQLLSLLLVDGLQLLHLPCQLLLLISDSLAIPIQSIGQFFPQLHGFIHRGRGGKYDCNRWPSPSIL